MINITKNYSFDKDIHEKHFIPPDFRFCNRRIPNQIYREYIEVDPSSKASDAKISDMSWICGYWKGTGFGEKCEELWMPAIGDLMHGTFRFESKGKLVFSEFMTICKDSSGIFPKVVHFNPDFTTWEEKNKTTNFRFIKADKNTIWFNGLTFRLNEKKELIIYLALIRR